MLRSTLRIPRMKYCAVLDSSQSNNASWKSMKKNSSDKIYYEEQISKSCLDQISLSNTPKLSSLMLSLMLENEWHASLPLKVFRTESRGKIPIRGEGCNTPGVSHKLSSEFGFK